MQPDTINYRKTRNTSRLSALWLETAAEVSTQLSFSIKDWDRLPSYAAADFARFETTEAVNFGRCCSRLEKALQMPVETLLNALKQEKPLPARCAILWHYQNPDIEFSQQEKSVRSFLEFGVGWFFQGGTDLALENVRNVDGFFCPRTGRLYPISLVLQQFGKNLVSHANAKELRIWVS